VVTLEFALLPLLMAAPYTLALFFPANLLVLRQRLRLEEQSLREFTDYNEKFPPTVGIAVGSTLTTEERDNAK
jgi:methyltransferase